MKASPQFKEVIQNYLNEYAKQDSLFAKSLEKENKNIDDCITYIFNQVKASGCNGFADEEIYNMAIHYYDEDDLKVGKPISGKVVVNHSIENKVVQPEPKQPEQPKPVQKKPKVVKLQPKTQVSIFDFDGV